MKISLIAMDMDGTLLQSDQTISEKTTKKLIELQQKGIKIVLVSGRNYNRLKRYAEQLQLEKYGGYLIEVNGMAINDLQKKQREVLERLSIQQARELFALLQPYEVETQYIMDDGLYVHIPEVCMHEKRNCVKNIISRMISHGPPVPQMCFLMRGTVMRALCIWNTLPRSSKRSIRSAFPQQRSSWK